MVFDQQQDNRAELQLYVPSLLRSPESTSGDDAPTDPGVEVEYVTLGGHYPGFEVYKALPDGFDWRTAETVFFSTDGDANSWGATSNLTEARDNSDEHPADTYWFEGVGWLSPADVAAQDGNTFIALCSPDPAAK